jgi:hypothetical protein
MTSETHAARRAARRAARCRISEIGLEFCCTSKMHVIAADGSLHIQTAHPKRKGNRPLTTYLSCLDMATCWTWRQTKPPTIFDPNILLIG